MSALLERVIMSIYLLKYPLFITIIIAQNIAVSAMRKIVTVQELLIINKKQSVFAVFLELTKLQRTHNILADSITNYHPPAI